MRGEDAFRSADLALADQCRLNVLWLQGGFPGGRALEIEVSALSLSGALASLCTEVVQVPFSALEMIERGGSLAFPDATFDLVTLYGCSPSPLALREMRRVLVNGGTALLAAENRWWVGRLRSPAAASNGSARLGLERAALRAGFRDACAYWVEPSLAIPRNLIPALHDRIQAFEAMRAREWGGDGLRAFAVAAGLHGILYPGLLVVAKA